MYAQKAGELLSESWEIKSAPDETNWPDLIVSTESGKFGLEVRELYLDENAKGSESKIIEKKNLQKIQKIADSYYKNNRSSIKVDFCGDIENTALILDTIQKSYKELTEFEGKRIEPYRGCVMHLLKIPDECNEYKRWRYLSDKIGWIKNVDNNIFFKAISEKELKLTKYRRKINDVRLLLVSDRTFNSGKIRLDHTIIQESCGFNNVYYLSYPMEVWQFFN